MFISLLVLSLYEPLLFQDPLPLLWSFFNRKYDTTTMCSLFNPVVAGSTLSRISLHYLQRDGHCLPYLTPP